MSPHFLFVHGWAMDASLWDGVRGELGAHAGSVRELGYLGSDAGVRGTQPPLPAAPIIAVGHSLGLMQLLEQPPMNLVGLVAINGFSRFARAADHPAGVSARVLDRMARRLEEDAEASVAAFRIRCGVIDTGRVPVSRPALQRGLEQLGHGDGRKALRHLAVPVLAMAATGDGIVPPGLSAACFEAVVWVEAEGHLLPLTHAGLCAQALRDFAGGLA